MIQRRINEQAIMFYSVFKWTILAVIVGVVVGFATFLFLSILELAITTTAQFPLFYLAAPLAFFGSAALIKYLAPQAEGHGTEKVIEAVHKNWGKIDPIVVPVKLVATIITIAFGGSVGKEGPCAQIGSGLASICADVLKLNKFDRRKLVICGISAGFAAIFGTPIGGAIFGIEVLFVGRMLYDLLLPSLIAGIVSFEVSSHLGMVPLRIPIAYTMQNSDFGYLFLAGLFFGLVALFMIIILEVIEEKAKHIKMWKPLKGIIGGIIIIALVQIFGTKFLGLGLDSMKDTLMGAQAMWIDPLAKVLYSAVTLGFGGSGGILAPVFFVGASAGSVFAGLFHLNLQFFAALGMLAVLAATTNTPIACIVMSAEIFGPNVLLPAAITCAIAYLINGHNSLYPSQILAFKKSNLIDVNEGEEMRKIETKMTPLLEPINRRLSVVKSFTHFFF